MTKTKRYFVYESGYNHDDPYFDNLEDAINDIKEDAEFWANDEHYFNRPDLYWIEEWKVEDLASGKVVYQATIEIEGVQNDHPNVTYYDGE